MLIQQLELREDGLSQLELRALRDLGNMAGARVVHIANQGQELTREEAIAAFSEHANKP